MKTRNFLFYGFLLLSALPAIAQVGIGTNSPVSSAALDVSSTNKGFMPPRMTLANRNAIASPVEGLLIWCTDCGVYGQIQVYNGAIWTNLLGGNTAGVPVIGDSDGGGKVAYILQIGDPGYVPGEIHGLIAAISDQGSAIGWGCFGTLIGGTSSSLGSGQMNTLAIVNGCAFNGAARFCYDLVLNNYDDWYLPSKDELEKLYLNSSAIGGFASNIYWSSTEDTQFTAWGLQFNGGAGNNFGKSTAYLVRPIRSF